MRLISALRLIDTSCLFRHGLRRIKSLIHTFTQASLVTVCLPDFAWLNASVEMVRFELMTPCLQGRCSPN